MTVSYSSPQQANLKAGDPGGVNIPTAIAESGQLSSTSTSYECFIDQRFSNKLQAFLVGYVSNVYSNYSVYQ